MNRKTRFGRCFLGMVLCLALALGCFAGCSVVQDMVATPGTTGEFPVEIGGVTVSARPQKAVVLSPSLADVIVALNCETQLAAGSSDCTQESLLALDKISGDNAQSIIDLGADLVIANELSGGIADALSAAGITVVQIAPAVDREDFERMYSQVASAFLGGGAGADRGIAAAQDIFTTLDDINRIVPKDKIVTACYLYDTESRAVTGDVFGDTIMSYAGVTNVFRSQTGGVFDFESLKLSDPDAIFCVPGLKDRIMSDSRFADFRAVTSGKVFEMGPEQMEWQGRTVVSATLEISGSCFPELTQEQSMVVTDPTDQIEANVSSAIASSALEADTTNYETLQIGDQNDNVLKMQARLEELGYLETEYNGFYGQYTSECVTAFQQVNGLEETGIADAETQRLMYSRLAKNKDGLTLPEAGAADATPQPSGDSGAQQ